ncbi:MAG: hypothetical protein U5J63_18435 [Fodinibius sp.]|nr:hypothetical protein [Fodinibius sp.]
MSNFTHLYLAEGLSSSKRAAEVSMTHERINVHLLPITRISWIIVADGTIHHSIVVAAVAKYLC